jgi:uncharacterized protein (TIGR00369 family)
MLDDTREREHPRCWVCGADNATGLGMDFRPDGSGGITAGFSCAERFSGYSGFIHGGVVSSLLDGAMTSCLLARGEVAVTADLHIRFRQPVLVGVPATITARIVAERHGLSTVEAQLEQEGEVRASGSGRFLAHPALRS